MNESTKNIRGDIHVYLYHMKECPEYHQLIHILATRTYHPIFTHTISIVGETPSGPLEEIEEVPEWYIHSRYPTPVEQEKILDFHIILAPFDCLQEEVIQTPSTFRQLFCRERPVTEWHSNIEGMKRIVKLARGIYTEEVFFPGIVIVGKPAPVNWYRVDREMRGIGIADNVLHDAGDKKYVDNMKDLCWTINYLAWNRWVQDRKRA